MWIVGDFLISHCNLYSINSIGDILLDIYSVIADGGSKEVEPLGRKQDGNAAGSDLKKKDMPSAPDSRSRSRSSRKKRSRRSSSDSDSSSSSSSSRSGRSRKRSGRIHRRHRWATVLACVSSLVHLSRG